ncbi:hypothetical protein GGS21DRAFT_512722 [Xylaria nigripes]|nr:hypothetical protein GGS21DRAFT_512722 [Xylaria nigripes]
MTHTLGTYLTYLAHTFIIPYAVVTYVRIRTYVRIIVPRFDRRKFETFFFFFPSSVCCCVLFVWYYLIWRCLLVVTRHRTHYCVCIRMYDL